MLLEHWCEFLGQSPDVLARRPVSCKPSSLTVFDGHTASPSCRIHQKMAIAGRRMWQKTAPCLKSAHTEGDPGIPATDVWEASTWCSGLVLFGLLSFFGFVFLYVPDLCLFVFFLADDLVCPVQECLNHRLFMICRWWFFIQNSDTDLCAWFFSVPWPRFP